MSGDPEVPPPILGRWRNLYLLEVAVLVALIVIFTVVGRIYS
ncbi:MAG: hypothetical protein AAFU79_03870 [Myxococcota bacterium]